MVGRDLIARLAGRQPPIDLSSLDLLAGEASALLICSISGARPSIWNHYFGKRHWDRAAGLGAPLAARQAQTHIFDIIAVDSILN